MASGGDIFCPTVDHLHALLRLKSKPSIIIRVRVRVRAYVNHHVPMCLDDNNQSDVQR
jgi:hypothetical protein